MAKDTFTKVQSLAILCTLIIASAIARREIRDDDLNNVDHHSYGHEEEEAMKYLEDLEEKYSHACNEAVESQWAYETNITATTEEKSVSAASKFAGFQGSVQKEILTRFPHWSTYRNDSVRRQFFFLVRRGPATMSPEDLKEMVQLGTEMESAFASAKVCEYGQKDPKTCQMLSLEPELTDKFTTSRDFHELDYYWNAWYDAVSNAIPTSKYKRVAELSNKYAKANNYGNMAELWASEYDDSSHGFSLNKFRQQILETWAQLRPYYEILHAYVRMKLRNDTALTGHLKGFGDYLPAHILGNIWAQDWSALANSTAPFADAPSLDVTGALKSAGYTPKRMFSVANEFFKGLGLPGMTSSFWKRSMMVKPKGREVVCHASSEDFCLGKDSKEFGIKMCTSVNQEDFYVVHHEMGHIEYYMKYTNQPYIFRDGANPGFHEAIGDTIALSVSTPRHLQCHLGLNISGDIDCSKEKSSSVSPSTTKEDINYLYLMALEKFPLYPFALSTDLWRWGIYEGTISESQYNDKWWELKREYMGIVPPEPRNSSSAGLDAGAKYHVAADYEYIRYFISYVLQFQFYEAMCVRAGQFQPDDPTSKPLHECDFSGREAAGKALGDMLALGLSQPWPVALKTLTGSEKLRVEPVLNYFKPLFTHLKDQLREFGEIPGFSKN